MADAIRILNPERRAVLVHGEGGWDEATPCCNFLVHTTSGEIKTLKAGDFGFDVCTQEQLRGGSPLENAQIAMDILNGDPGPARQTVLLNSLLGYRAYYPDSTNDAALKAVTDSIDSGAARNIVAGLRQRFPGEIA